MSGTVAVIDYGMGNLHSVASALEHVGADKVLVTHDAELIRQADRVVFPGVGAIRDCMAEIRRLKCDELLRSALEAQHKPVLAICVGLQALMTRSEENGGVDCLGLLEGEVRHFGKPLYDANGERLKVPHMGWNRVQQRRRKIPDQQAVHDCQSKIAKDAGGNARPVRPAALRARAPPAPGCPAAAQPRRHRAEPPRPRGRLLAPPNRCRDRPAARSPRRRHPARWTRRRREARSRQGDLRSYQNRMCTTPRAMSAG